MSWTCEQTFTCLAPSMLALAVHAQVTATESFDASGACASDSDPRACSARELLKQLEASGATAAVKLSVRAGPAGHGVFVDEPVAGNTTILTIPRRLWVRSLNGDASSLAVALGHEMQQPSAPHLAAYVASLPTACPPNLAARAAADIDVAAASPLHVHRVQVLAKDLDALAGAFPGPDEQERRTLLACLKMSRGLNDLADDQVEEYPAVMVPFVDLINHHPERNVFEMWHRDDSVGLTLFAPRPLAAGTELRFPYREPASAARLLLAFGFRSGPAAALPVEGAALETEHSEAFLRAHGCAARPHIPLAVGDDLQFGEADLRAGLRCMRLLVYTPIEAWWALSTGYLDHSLLEEKREAFQDFASDEYEGCVRKDAYAVYNTMRSCEYELGEESDADEAAEDGSSRYGDEGGWRRAGVAELLGRALSADGVSDDVAEVVLLERTALVGCLKTGGAVIGALEARGSGLMETLANAWRDQQEQEQELQEQELQEQDEEPCICPPCCPDEEETSDEVGRAQYVVS